LGVSVTESVSAEFFQLVFGARQRSVVSHRSHADEDVRTGQRSEHSVTHLQGAGHAHPAHLGRRRQAHLPAHQHHLGAGLRTGARQRVAHLARADVGDAAHRIDRLEGRSGGDHHLAPGQQPRHEEALETLEQLFGFEHSSHADFAAGLVAGCGAEHGDAVGTHLGEVALGGRRLPHLPVHRRGDDQRHRTRQA